MTMNVSDKDIKKIQTLYKQNKILVEDLSKEELDALIELYIKQNLAIEKKLNSEN